MHMALSSIYAGQPIVGDGPHDYAHYLHCRLADMPNRVSDKFLYARSAYTMIHLLLPDAFGRAMAIKFLSRYHSMRELRRKTGSRLKHLDFQSSRKRPVSQWSYTVFCRHSHIILVQRPLMRRLALRMLRYTSTLRRPGCRTVCEACLHCKYRY